MTLSNVMILLAGLMFLWFGSVWSGQVAASAATPVEVSSGPQVLFQEVGQVYAECDFAHVMIELPIRDLINRTDYVYDVFRSRMGKNNSDSSVKWVPAWREVQMHALLEHKATQVFNLRDTVLARFQAAGNGDGRFGRDISVNIDPVGMINAFFSGINNWIHASSISELKERLGVLAHDLEGIKAVEQAFSANQQKLAEALASYINDTEVIYETNHIDLVLWLMLDELHEVLSAVVLASGDLARAHLPAWLLPPNEAVQTLQVVNDFAMKKEQQAALVSPMDLHSVPTTVVADSDSWYVVLHVPLISPRNALKAFWFTNAPFLVGNDSVRFDGPSGLVGHSNDLWQDLRAVFISEGDIGSTCTQYDTRFICPGVPVSRNPPCPVSLLYERSDRCDLIPAAESYISVGRDGPTLIFTASPLDIAFKCGEDVYIDTYRGLNIFNVSEGCRVESANFTLYIPQSIGGDSLHFRSIPEELLQAGFNSESSRSREVAGILASIQDLAPAVELLQNRSSAPPLDLWGTPEAVTVALASLALFGVLLLTGVCLCAGRAAQRIH